MQKERRVLVTEDDMPARRLLMTLLMREGYLVDFARDGAEAIEKIAVNHYHAILLDMMMPAVDGFDVLEYMERATKGHARDCVIVLTAASNRDLRGLDRASVFRVIRKPFDLAELVAVLRECADRSAFGDST